MSPSKSDVQREVVAIEKKKPAEPPMYKVLIFNDDFTTKEFVVEILVTVFHKSNGDASSLMWHVHRNGSGVCGVYPYDIAQTKIDTVSALAREHGFPLKLGLEKE